MGYPMAHTIKKIKVSMGGDRNDFADLMLSVRQSISSSSQRRYSLDQAMIVYISTFSMIRVLRRTLR